MKSCHALHCDTLSHIHSLSVGSGTLKMFSRPQKQMGMLGSGLHPRHASTTCTTEFCSTVRKTPSLAARVRGREHVPCRFLFLGGLRFFLFLGGLILQRRSTWCFSRHGRSTWSLRLSHDGLKVPTSLRPAEGNARTFSREASASYSMHGDGGCCSPLTLRDPALSFASQ